MSKFFNHYKIALYILLSFLLNRENCVAQCHLDDWQALKAIYESTNGDEWLANYGWEVIKDSLPHDNCDLGNLFGIDIDTLNMRVNVINLRFNNLRGIIPPEIGNLAGLTDLDLSNNIRYSKPNIVRNNLNGSIPIEIENLINLRYIDISFNNLNGNILTIGNLKNIRRIDLSNNNLAGVIPPEIGDLSALRTLNLSAIF